MSRSAFPMLALAALLVLPGCGDQRSAEAKIHDDTADVVSALNAKNTAAARRALATLEADLAAAARLGQLEPGVVADLRAGVTTLKGDLGLISPTPSPTPQRTTPAPVRPRGEKHHKHHEHGD